MREIKLEIQDHLGEVVKEQTLTLSDGDKLVVEVNKDIPQEGLTQIHKAVEDYLTGDYSILTLANYVDLKILKVN